MSSHLKYRNWICYNLSTRVSLLHVITLVVVLLGYDTRQVRSNWHENVFKNSSLLQYFELIRWIQIDIFSTFYYRLAFKMKAKQLMACFLISISLSFSSCHINEDEMSTDNNDSSNNNTVFPKGTSLIIKKLLIWIFKYPIRP